MPELTVKRAEKEEDSELTISQRITSLEKRSDYQAEINNRNDEKFQAIVTRLSWLEDQLTR